MEQELSSDLAAWGLPPGLQRRNAELMVPQISMS